MDGGLPPAFQKATNSLSIVIGILVGRAADQPFHQTASVLLSDQALPFFIFRSDVIFLLSLIP